MSRVWTAFRAFFLALVNAQKAEAIRAALDGQVLPKIDIEAKPQPIKTPAEPDRPARSEAITLLAALQREARLVDLIQQPLDTFSDEQIGGAARNVLRDSAAVLNRFFSIAPVVNDAEGATIEIAKVYDPAAFKLEGRVEGGGPFHGKIVHQGWKATNCTLPAWTGSKAAALVIAPAEVEV